MSSRAEILRNLATRPPMRLTPERREWTLLAVILFALVTLIAVVASLPSTEEKAAILIAEQRYDQAIDLLQSADERTALSRYETFTLIRLYLLTGEPDKAILSLEEELSRRRDSAWAMRELVALYRARRDFAGEAGVLRRLFMVGPGVADYRRLLGLYRLNGDYDGERLLIADAAAANLAGPYDLARLAELESGRAQLVEATVWVSASGPFSNHSPDLHLAASEVVTATATTRIP